MWWSPSSAREVAYMGSAVLVLITAIQWHTGSNGNKIIGNLILLVPIWVHLNSITAEKGPGVKILDHLLSVVVGGCVPQTVVLPLAKERLKVRTSQYLNEELVVGTLGVN